MVEIKKIKTLSGKEVEVVYTDETKEATRREVENGKQELADIYKRLQKIEAKEKCLRVQFLDWLSDKLLNWSNRVHETACRIDSPCIIKVEPRKKEESKSAKENKELARMREFLKDYQDENRKLAAEKTELQNIIKSDVTKALGELSK